MVAAFSVVSAPRLGVWWFVSSEVLVPRSGDPIPDRASSLGPDGRQDKYPALFAKRTLRRVFSGDPVLLDRAGDVYQLFTALSRSAGDLRPSSFRSRNNGDRLVSTLWGVPGVPRENPRRFVGLLLSLPPPSTTTEDDNGLRPFRSRNNGDRLVSTLWGVLGVRESSRRFCLLGLSSLILSCVLWNGSVTMFFDRLDFGSIVVVVVVVVFISPPSAPSRFLGDTAKTSISFDSLLGMGGGVEIDK